MPPKASPAANSTEDFRRRLYLFFQKYDPPRLNTILAMALKAEGKENAFMSAMVKKYGPEPPFTPFSAEERDGMRQRLREFYNKNDPQKLAGVESVINKYLGAEPELFAQLKKKYSDATPSSANVKAIANAPPHPPPTAAAPSASREVSDTAGNATHDGGNAAQSKEELRERVVRYYQHYDPAKMSVVDSLMSKYGDEPAKLMKALVKKYGPEPEYTPPSPTPAKASLATKEAQQTAPTAKKPPAKDAPPKPATPPPSSAEIAPSPPATVDAVPPKEEGAVSVDDAAPPKQPADGGASSIAEDTTPAPARQGEEDAKGEGEQQPPEGGGDSAADTPFAPWVGEEEAAGVLPPVEVSAEDNGAASRGEPSEDVFVPPPPVIRVSLPFLTAASFDYFEDASEALELVTILFNMFLSADGLSSSVAVVEYLREQLGDEFIAYLRGFSVSSAGAAALGMGEHCDPLAASAEWMTELTARLKSVFERFEPSLIHLAPTLAQCCQGRADDLIVAIHARYAAQFSELQKKDQLAAQFKKRVADFLAYHCANAVSLTAFLAETFKYNKEELMRELRRIYGPEPTIMDTHPVKLYTPAIQAAEAAKLKTREGLLQRCLEHVRLYSYLCSTSALTTSAASASLGIKPLQWTNALYRIVVSSLLDLFTSTLKAIETLSYACGPEEVADVGAEFNSPSEDAVSFVAECLQRNGLDVNAVFLIINNDLVTPPPNTCMGSRDLLEYFVELCDDAFAPKPLSSAAREVMRRYVKAHPEQFLSAAQAANVRKSSRTTAVAGVFGAPPLSEFAARDAADSAKGVEAASESAVEAAVDAFYESRGCDEAECMTHLERHYGPPPPAEVVGEERGVAFVAATADGETEGAVYGGGYGAVGGPSINKNSTRQAMVEAILEEEAESRRRIAFDQYCELSNASSRLRTAIASIRAQAQLREELARLAIPRHGLVNPLA